MIILDTENLHMLMAAIWCILSPLEKNSPQSLYQEGYQNISEYPFAVLYIAFMLPVSQGCTTLSYVKTDLEASCSRIAVLPCNLQPVFFWPQE